jgi:hypothetical protein
MRHRRRAQWVLAVAVSFVLLIAPAIWNGFPLLQYDTGGYLARWYEGILVPSRAVAYGLMLTASVPLAFWPVLALQAGLTVWIVALILRAHRLGGRPWLLAVMITLLSVFTTLPWLSAILLTDIFCGQAILALYLLLLRGDALARWERWALFILIAVAASTHSATMAVLCGLLLCGGVVRLLDPRRLPDSRLQKGFWALVLGACLVFGANYLVAGRLVWTPGGFALSFGRMLQDGIVKKYLDEHCPDPALRLCAVKDQLPQDADQWFWGSPLFDRLGRFAGLGKEMETITVRSISAYPALQIRAALAASAGQLIDVHSGEGVVNWVWHTYGIIDRFTPQLAPAMHAARQQQGGFSFDAINAVQYPVALFGMAALPILLLLAASGVVSAATGELAATILLAILGNAFVCGVLSNPHDRYGARVVWLAVFVVLVAAADIMTRRVPDVAVDRRHPMIGARLREAEDGGRRGARASRKKRAPRA